MELIQFSTLTCPPCRMAREYITRNYDPTFLNYTYIPLEYLNDFDDKYIQLANKLQIRGVPLFVVMEGDEIIQTFRGFDKEKIDKYAEYINKITVSNKVKEIIPEELEIRIDATYEQVLKSLNSNHENNGKLDKDDLDDYLDINAEDLDE